MRPLIVSFVMAAVLAMVAASSGANMHPFHSTLAELEWNPKSSVFEVSLQMSGVEIEDELSRLHGRRINLESTDGAESLLEDYVRKHFQVRDANHPSCDIRWVGIEVQVRYVWAYFEVRLTDKQASETGPPAETIDSDATIVVDPAVDNPDQQIDADQKDDQPQTSFQDLKVRSTLLTQSRPNQVNFVTVTTPAQTGSAHLTCEQSEARVEFVNRPNRRGHPAGKDHNEGH